MVSLKLKSSLLIRNYLKIFSRCIMRKVKVSIKGVLSVLVFWIFTILIIWGSVMMPKEMFAIFLFAGMVISVIIISIEIYSNFK